jgi:hypothetical protein
MRTHGSRIGHLLGLKVNGLQYTPFSP